MRFDTVETGRRNAHGERIVIPVLRDAVPTRVAGDSDPLPESFFRAWAYLDELEARVAS